MKERPTKCIFKVNHILYLEYQSCSYMFRRHLQGTQRILMKLCICYVISAE
jgi:hypothetical protein